MVFLFSGFYFTKNGKLPVYQGIAKRVLDLEAREIAYVSSKIGRDFDLAVEAIKSTSGRVVVSGMGKSGHIGKKMFATFVSTGTPSMFLHPAEAFHGDLGMVKPEDIFLAISNSGETREILNLLPFIRDNKNYLISMTGSPSSELATSSDCNIDIGVREEACPLQLAPTSSTTATLAVGDALAIALMEARSFSAEGFARFHPGGALGRKLLGKVCDYMIAAETVSMRANVKEIIGRLSRSRVGLVCVVEEDRLIGVITDGDVIRALESSASPNLDLLAAAQIMSDRPKVISSIVRCSDADATMSESGVNSLVVNHLDNKFYVYQNLNRG